MVDIHGKNIILILKQHWKISTLILMHTLLKNTLFLKVEAIMVLIY